MKETTTIEVGEDKGVHHIPGVHNMQITLCGFVDVGTYTEHDYINYPCNCCGCQTALRKIQALKFPEFYFVKPKQ